MADPKIEKLAQTLVDYSVAVREGDRVLIDGCALAEPLLKGIYIKVLQAGGHPLMMVSLLGTEEIFFRHASDEQLRHVPKPLFLITSKNNSYCITQENNLRNEFTYDLHHTFLRFHRPTLK